MRQKIKLLLASTSLILFIGCGAGDTVDALTDGKAGRNTSSTVKFDMASDKSSFTITLDGNPGDNIHHTGAEYKLFDADESNILDAALTGNGKITTTCQQSAATSDAITYSCMTKKDFKTVIGKPNDTTQEVSLKVGQKYTLYKVDTYLYDKKVSLDIDTDKTIIDSFTL